MAENFETEEKVDVSGAEEEVTTDTEEAVDGGSEEVGADAEAEQEEAAEAETSEEDGDEDEQESDKQSDKKKGFIKKKDKRDELIEELNDRVKRQMAEFENFRKRSDKEKSAMYDMGAKAMLEKILPVVDNFERGLAVVPEDEDNPFAEGMRMVYKQLMTTLEEAGVTEIEAVGCEFDPEKHNAVMHIDDDAYGENEIVEVMQKGFMYHDSVVRYSMVKVAN